MRRRDLIIYILMGILLGIAVVMLLNLLIGLLRGDSFWQVVLTVWR
jgi:hypothetical protein